MLLRPSSAEIWANCPGSVKMPSVDSADTSAADEGTLLHLLTVFYAQGRIRPDATPEEINADPGFKAENKTGLFVSYEHPPLAKLAASYCVARPGVGSQWETAIDGGNLLPGVKGTCDFMRYDPHTRTMYVVDLKFGFGPVKAIGNKQLLCYSVGAANACSHQIDNWVLVIFQPRDYVTGEIVKEWKLTAEDWREEVEELAKAAQHAIDTIGTFRTGGHCKWCKGRTHCKVFLADALTLSDALMVSSGNNTDHADLGKLLEYFKLVEERMVSARKGLEDRMIAEIRKGNHFEDWHTRRRPGRAKWIGDGSQLKAVEAMTGQKLFREVPITITEARGNPILKPLLSGLTEKPEGKEELVKYDSNHAKEVFK